MYHKQAYMTLASKSLLSEVLILGKLDWVA